MRMCCYCCCIVRYILIDKSLSINLIYSNKFKFLIGQQKMIFHALKHCINQLEKLEAAKAA